ncbi:hypothetical protein [Deinococcus wulumuqiensis]|uniref:Phage tail protein n=1 Tax=Deinococcus wulumuqiensis TaxID=980427 RepID=A0AAV4K7E3_9DEIO|nr:hypothetical protein [Deinococcus wulumuqiensis]QII20175.1 hypothetical protein G6R31_04880 [Deinococcus wulumuqiensis R12]GGI75459.1 hypothetical protein GCM10010914_07100 [Deinococcus wulumuqiensis]GGP28726.1 hypothetical protein GCM10008021_03770 [Deinococcus wulumuqiensis]
MNRILIPNPILFGATPPEGAVLPVTADLGGLDQYLALGLVGPAATVEVAEGAGWAALSYPHLLTAGQTLRLRRSDPQPTLTTLLMLAPVADLPPDGTGTTPAFVVSTDLDGYQTIEGAEITLDAEGYQTITNATATADADGYQTVKES